YLYYKNKQDLLAGVVGRFWTQLTLGAEAAIEPDAATREQLEQLGHYHLNSILDQFEVVSLTYRARPQQEQDLDQVREYVRVFDRIMQRGVDRGELPEETPIGQLRDVFFGTLEFSARTLKLRDLPYDHSVVSNLLALMVGASDATLGQAKGEEPSNRDLMNTLKSIQKQLKRSGDL
ncbi:MAG: TetR/AcrR family transcriptional regulator C-terminal domain-containing protein, partial [Halieaceae bacterium]